MLSPGQEKGWSREEFQMGLGHSEMRSSPSPREGQRKLRRGFLKRTLSSLLICGASSSRSPDEVYGVFIHYMSMMFRFCVVVACDLLSLFAPFTVQFLWYDFYASWWARHGIAHFLEWIICYKEMVWGLFCVTDFSFSMFRVQFCVFIEEFAVYRE